MLTVLALCLLQTQAQAQPLQVLPRRTYQPTLYNPGIDGGTGSGFSRGELTPDGKLLIGFRRFPDPAYASKFRSALTAAFVHADRIVGDGDGNLVEFYDDTPVGGLHGSDFTFGAWSTDPLQVEYARIHWGYELIDCAGTPAPLCISPCTAPGSLAQSVKLDTYYPVPDTFGSAQMTVCMRPLATANPYPSLGDGTYSASGTFETYELWVVRTHHPDFLGTHACRNDAFGPLVQPTIANSQSYFTSQNVQVVVDPALGKVVSTSVAQHEPLTTRVPNTPAIPNDWIRGIEPSITADGRLILFHGKGSNPLAQSGSAIVTYIFNLDPCDPAGWTPPRSVTELPTLADLHDGTTQVMTVEEFKQTYRLFAQPVRMPKSSFSGTQTTEVPPQPLPGEPYTSGQNVVGTYPWVSKDGSFWNAYSVRGTDALDPAPQGSPPCTAGPHSTRTKCAAYACGDLTNGVIKHIDDPGINPTRHGGPWAWPRHQNFYPQYPFCTDPVYPNSWGAISMSTGASPGLWEFHFGSDVPIPSMDVDFRVPAMPLIVPTIDTYGEIRFEEADGDFTLYLACNESLYEDATAWSQNFLAFLIDPTTTPDSAGYVDAGGDTSTALSTLNPAAAFPQELYHNTLGGTYQDASEQLRLDVGSHLLGPAAAPHVGPEPFHENLGFKGQAIVFGDDGAIDVTGSVRLGDPASPGDPVDTFTVQAFVKLVDSAYTPSGSTRPIVEYGLEALGTKYPAFRLELKSDGSFEGILRTDWTTTPGLLVAETRRNAVERSSTLADPTDGWRHVAVTYQADATANESKLRIYLDGLLEDTATFAGYLPIPDATHPVVAIDPYYIVGPGRGGSPSALVEVDAVLLLDEVAVSRVRRNVHELRRDAFVVPKNGPFDPWPSAQLSLPVGLDESEAAWPLDVDPDPTMAVIGQQLFASDTLSADPSDPLVSGSRSCATCHDPALSFTDGVAQQPVVGGPGVLDFNAPTLINMGMGTHKTFSGSAAKLQDQIVQPLTSGDEMGPQDMSHVLARIGLDPALGPLFGASFPLTEDNVFDALAMFMLYQNKGTAEFDTTPQGLDPQEQLGRELFFGKARCFHCHRGSNFSDDAFHNVRTVADGAGIKDRFAVTGRANERGQLKTPTLRNLNDTGPYFHDGIATTLDQVVDHYNDPFSGVGPLPAVTEGPADRTLRRLELSDPEKAALIAFLRTLSE